MRPLLIQKIERVSKPGRRVYAGAEWYFPGLLMDWGVVSIVSTRVA